MEIDRRVYLQLVAAIATSTACGAKQDPPPVMVPIEIPPLPSAPLATSPAPPPSSSRAESPSQDELETQPVSAAGGIWAQPYDPSARARSCAELKCPTPTQEGMGALRNACRTIEKRVTTETFQRFMTCMMARNNTRDTCDLMLVGEKPGECLHDWYDTPTIDPTTAAKCKPIVAACAGPNRSVHANASLSMSDCQKILSVTNPAAEKKMIHCVTEYCDGALSLCHGGYG